MDQKLTLKSASPSYPIKREPTDWLPYSIAIIGSLLSFIIWYNLLLSQSIDSIKVSIPWIILVLGVSLALLSAATVRLTQLTKERASALAELEDNFKKEISAHIKAKETKQKLEIALLQGQKLQAIGTLAGGIAHDFNNLLYAIKGYVEMAREDVGQDTLIFKNLGKVLEASVRGQELVARILAFGRRNVNYEFNPIPIKKTIESVLDLLRPTIPASVNIHLLNFPKDCVILGNPTQLHQVIVNLINNAVDAMDGEGTITIEFNLVSADDEFLEQLPNRARTNYCKIDISDTGHGMDQTTMERIFEPFYTTKEVGKGTGLGLSTVHKIIEQHHGEISIKSQLGYGTTFTLLFPEYQPTLTEKENIDHDNYSISGR